MKRYSIKLFLSTAEYGTLQEIFTIYLQTFLFVWSRELVRASTTRRPGVPISKYVTMQAEAPFNKNLSNPNVNSANTEKYNIKSIICFEIYNTIGACFVCLLSAVSFYIKPFIKVSLAWHILTGSQYA